MEKSNNENELRNDAIKSLNEQGWKSNNNNLYSDYLEIEKKVSINGSQYVFDILLYIYQVKTPIAIIEIQKNIQELKNESRILSNAKHLDCPIIIYSNGEECRVKDTTNSTDLLGDFSIVSPLKLSIIYSDWLIGKCNAHLSSYQIDFISKNTSSKIHKFYNTEIKQTCIIVRTYTDIANNNYSIPEYGFYYYIVNEKGEIIKQTDSEHQMEEFYKYAIFLFDGSLRK
jgi:type I site-specific restriction endonuclease